jgi:hypothetical protein
MVVDLKKHTNTILDALNSVSVKLTGQEVSHSSVGVWKRKSEERWERIVRLTDERDDLTTKLASALSKVGTIAERGQELTIQMEGLIKGQKTLRAEIDEWKRVCSEATNGKQANMSPAALENYLRGMGSDMTRLLEQLRESGARTVVETKPSPSICVSCGTAFSDEGSWSSNDAGPYCSEGCLELGAAIDKELREDPDTMPGCLGCKSQGVCPHSTKGIAQRCTLYGKIDTQPIGLNESSDGKPIPNEDKDLQYEGGLAGRLMEDAKAGHTLAWDGGVGGGKLRLARPDDTLISMGECGPASSAPDSPPEKMVSTGVLQGIRDGERLKNEEFRRLQVLAKAIQGLIEIKTSR